MKEIKFIDYVVDESLTLKELNIVINHCENVMELRNKDWTKASELRDKCLELIYQGNFSPNVLN